MDEGFKRLLESIEIMESKNKRVIKKNRFKWFNMVEKAILEDFADSCEATMTTTYAVDSITVTIVGELIMISEYDQYLKKILMGKDVLVRFSAQNDGNVNMTLTIYCTKWKKRWFTKKYKDNRRSK